VVRILLSSPWIMARVHNHESYNYNELIQLYFERSNAVQQYWNLYVIIVGGVLAFSSLRKRRRNYHRAGLHFIRPVRL
jgi:hypothetical protein